jgi:uncharacterized membrane protein YphA (DoxX/SURF4 family)
MKHIDRNFTDLIFRLLFCLIFIGLGGEHLIKDELLQKMMPEWIPYPKAISILCGCILLIGGSLIAIGYKLRHAAILLGTFLIVVTAIVHGPGISIVPQFISPESEWLWQVLQRSNYVKNLCLLGVCLLLIHYQPGKWSLEAWLKRKGD